MISDDKFQEIIDKTDIVGLVGEYVELTKKGNGYFGLCPFHDDSSPSFSVSVDKKIAKCMSCGEGGNPITFLKKIKKIPTNEAISILAQKAGVQIDLNIAVKKEDKNKKYYDIYKVAQEFYSYNLFNSKSGKIALEYLYKRGLTEDTIKSFGIGLAPSNKDTLTKVLSDNNFLDIDCIEVGLIKNNGTNLYDIFMNRIMFPITNENGQTIAFSGRLYDGSNGPKYVNTMETIIYRKGDHLYNLSNAINQINKTKRVILCEGQMDAIKISNSNLKDVVCALGSALTLNQVKLIKKYATNVVLAYDNDTAGVKATKTAINLLKGLTIDVLQLPSGVDPDEYITNNSVEKFHELFDKRINSIEFIYNSYFIDKNIYSLVHVEEIKNNVFKYINTLSSNTIKEQLFNKLASDLKINYDNLLKDYNLISGVKTKSSYKQNTNYQTKANNQQNSVPVHAYEPPPMEYDNNYISQDNYYNQAPQIVDYIPDAPPESFGSEIYYGDEYNYNKPSVANRPTVQPNYNHSTSKINVVNTFDDKKMTKAYKEACKNVIALGMYKLDYFESTIEKVNGDDFAVYLPSPYFELYDHLSYVRGENKGVTIKELHSSFMLEGHGNSDYNEVVDVLNSYNDDLNLKKVLNDGLELIIKIYNESHSKKNIEKAVTENQIIDGMNEFLEAMRISQKIKK